MNANLIEIIMGSQSDWAVMQEAGVILELLGLPYRARVVSAHRTPARMFEFASQAGNDGVKVIIAGAGGAAHLPGMVAALTHLPVIAVPVPSKHLNGLDSLLSIAQMPRGVAVATQAIGAAGAFNAGLLAAQILALEDTALQQRLIAWRKEQTSKVSEEIV
jgi:5-(carboxyamino)imidazole ribonucleotide mutase